MSSYGFTFEALYRLDVNELADIARLIKGEKYYLSPNKQVLIRGIIIPFLREAGKAPAEAAKDEVMRLALIRVAKLLKVSCESWEAAEQAWLVKQIKQQWYDRFRRKLEELTPQQKEAVFKAAEAELKRRAAGMGISFIPAAGVVVGEMSGFGIYMVTTTGLSALSSALGVTFSWGVYQGATTLLGIALGPVGWALAGTGVLVAGIGLLSSWLNGNDPKLQVVVLSIIIALGDSPYDWFGLPETASFDEIKTAYRAMMKTLHPDVTQNNLPDWVKQRFNEWLLLTQENYQKIKKDREE